MNPLSATNIQNASFAASAISTTIAIYKGATVLSTNIAKGQADTASCNEAAIATTASMVSGALLAATKAIPMPEGFSLGKKMALGATLAGGVCALGALVVTGVKYVNESSKTKSE